MFRVLDLFSGIGGFTLGLERTNGFRTVAFCEIDPFCRRVLSKHWPEVPCYHDVRELNADMLAADGIAVDVVCGGFPCQDISVAGKGAGLKGKRSGLWSEIARLSSELRPSYIIVENVAALLSRGLDRVLGDLAAVGFDAEWHCIPASALGAPHRRDRFWLVAYPGCFSSSARRAPRDMACATRTGEVDSQEWQRDGHAARDGRANLAYAKHRGREGWDSPWQGAKAALPRCRWEPEPNVGRVAHGVPKRVDRLRALGNAVVPQIPEMIGRAILARDK